MRKRRRKLRRLSDEGETQALYDALDRLPQVAKGRGFECQVEADQLVADRMGSGARREMSSGATGSGVVEEARLNLSFPYPSVLYGAVAISAVACKKIVGLFLIS